MATLELTYLLFMLLLFIYYYYYLFTNVTKKNIIIHQIKKISLQIIKYYRWN